jgi:hypothetical protein
MPSFAMNNTPSNPEAENEETHPLDPRIATALQELGICYDSDSEGNFYMLVEFDDNRFQQVCIRSRTQEFLGVEMREIFSVALVSTGILDARTSNFLLRENLQKNLGAWAILDGSESQTAIFTAKVSSSLPSRMLSEILAYLAETADGVEQRLSGLDEF